MPVCVGRGAVVDARAEYFLNFRGGGKKEHEPVLKTSLGARSFFQSASGNTKVTLISVVASSFLCGWAM